MAQPQKTSKSLEETLGDALKTASELDLKNDRADAVRLAVQALLLMRGALDPELFKRQEIFNPYPHFVKYIRASNAETLGALTDEIIRAISPKFITLQALGELAEAIYRPETELDDAALNLLKEETTPLVLLMKKIYRDARGFDEADRTEPDGTNEGETQGDTN